MQCRMPMWRPEQRGACVGGSNTSDVAADRPQPTPPAAAQVHLPCLHSCLGGCLLLVPCYCCHCGAFDLGQCSGAWEGRMVVVQLCRGGRGVPAADQGMLAIRADEHRLRAEVCRPWKLSFGHCRCRVAGGWCHVPVLGAAVAAVHLCSAALWHSAFCNSPRRHPILTPHQRTQS
jgi:hypothetical protein